jgi:hypothetical protein
MIDTEAAMLGHTGAMMTKLSPAASAAVAAAPMKSGVGRSPSPYHSGMTAGSPMPSAEISPMREVGRSRIASRTRIASALAFVDGL